MISDVGEEYIKCLPQFNVNGLDFRDWIKTKSNIAEANQIGAGTEIAFMEWKTWKRIPKLHCI